MPKFNADIEQLSEPIEITLEGKEYKINKITTKTLKQADDLIKGDKKDVNAPIKQLAVLLGVDFTELEGIDIRKINSALDFITKHLIEFLDVKKKETVS